MKAQNADPSENAAASAASPGTIDSSLNRNPLVALGAALLRPFVGRLGRRPTPTAVEKLRMEHYRSVPVTAPSAGDTKDARRMREGSPKDAPVRRSRVGAGSRRSAAPAAGEGGRSHA